MPEARRERRDPALDLAEIRWRVRVRRRHRQRVFSAPRAVHALGTRAGHGARDGSTRHRGARHTGSPRRGCARDPQPKAARGGAGDRLVHAQPVATRRRLGWHGALAGDPRADGGRRLFPRAASGARCGRRPSQGHARAHPPQGPARRYSRAREKRVRGASRELDSRRHRRAGARIARLGAAREPRSRRRLPCSRTAQRRLRRTRRHRALCPRSAHRPLQPSLLPRAGGSSSPDAGFAANPAPQHQAPDRRVGRQMAVPTCLRESSMGGHASRRGDLWAYQPVRARCDCEMVDRRTPVALHLRHRGVVSPACAIRQGVSRQRR